MHARPQLEVALNLGKSASAWTLRKLMQNAGMALGRSSSIPTGQAMDSGLSPLAWQIRKRLPRAARKPLAVDPMGADQVFNAGRSQSLPLPGSPARL